MANCPAVEKKNGNTKKNKHGCICSSLMDKKSQVFKDKILKRLNLRVNDTKEKKIKKQTFFCNRKEQIGMFGKVEMWLSNHGRRRG